MSVQSTLTDEMEQYGEMLLWRWDAGNPSYEDEVPTEYDDVVEATILLFPDASDRQVAEITSMAHGFCDESEVAEIREEME